MTALRAAAAAIVVLAGLAGATATTASANRTGPDWVSSDNVEYLGSLKQDIGMTTGAKIVGDRMFVTSGKNITVYDISRPDRPRTLGAMKVNVAWENEEVPTNGKVLAVASDFYSAVPSCVSALKVLGCVQFFDVRDPSNIREVGSVPIANHTVECALDCQYFYGKTGTIIDARGILDGTPPKVIGNWQAETAKQGVPEASCHHIREIRPGVLLTACRPFAVISINAADGGTPAVPKVLSTGQAAKFVHSARWPRQGRDRFVLTGGEKNFTGRCERNDSEFSTYDASGVLTGRSTTFAGPLAQIAPAGNGTYTDGKPVANHLGCSVHWFQEHSSFRNGGLVALSEYEDGVRFLQIRPDGSIVEQGFFAALGSSSSSPKWAGRGDVVYSIDYDRGIDILRWTGQHYVPREWGHGFESDRGRERGTNGTSPLPALTRLQQAQRSRLVGQLRAQGWFPGYCRLAAERT